MRLVMIGGLLAMAATNAQALDLKLRCEGMASKLESQTTYASVSGDVDLNGSATKYGVGQQRDRLLVEITDEGGRVRPPAVILPPIKGKGAGDGWWKLENLQIGETEITARFNLNVMNRPTVRIDRTTGDIELTGYMYTRFNGRCSVADPAARAF